ncbi:MAG: hypothetical protein ACXW0H_08285 [Methylobacter sp.]
MIDASGFLQKMRKSLGSKRKELPDEHIAEITRLIGQFIEVCNCKKSISRIYKTATSVIAPSLWNARWGTRTDRLF